jgi:hypothetical protein
MGRAERETVLPGARLKGLRKRRQVQPRELGGGKVTIPALAKLTLLLIAGLFGA